MCSLGNDDVGTREISLATIVVPLHVGQEYVEAKFEHHEISNMATTDQWQNQLGALSFYCVLFLNAPQEGEILIDGVDLNAYDQNSLKR